MFFIFLRNRNQVVMLLGCALVCVWSVAKQLFLCASAKIGKNIFVHFVEILFKLDNFDNRNSSFSYENFKFGNYFWRIISFLPNFKNLKLGWFWLSSGSESSFISNGSTSPRWLRKTLLKSIYLILIPEVISRHPFTACISQLLIISNLIDQTFSLKI